MQETLNSIQDLFKGLSSTAKLCAIFAILAAGLAWTWITTPDEPETAPTTQVTTGDKTNTSSGDGNQNIGGETININK